MPAGSRRRRCPPDTSVAEWALLEPLLPVPAYQTKTGGHPEEWPLREIVDGIRCIVDNGAKWRALPRCGVEDQPCAGGAVPTRASAAGFREPFELRVTTKGLASPAA